MLLFPSFSNLCLANAVEPLRAANTLSKKPLYRWTHVGLDAGPVRSSSGLPVTPDTALSGLAGADYLLVMPSYGHRDFAKPATLRALRAAARRCGAVGGLDTGSLLLAAAGLMDGYRATSHWDVLDEFAEGWPEVEVVPDRVVIDRDRVSCGGATTTLELMLELIAQHHGPMLSLDVAALFMHGERPAAPAAPPGLARDRVLRAAAALMRRHLEPPLPIPEIARRLGISQRGLEMRCRAAAGRTPQGLYAAIRMAEAQRLVQDTTLSVTEIAGRVGYADASAMTRMFRRQFGVTPQALRTR
ncbi:helix-turn-helix domain-containing protein [Roseibacterium sp. KMU-115]|uniref:Helix-turn-helix domain-containing protein n=1 Tax=Roseicyclus persicicus TaxID=2650661 RepID=A0A7X6H0C1_9RHOB|nr:helix-turn-helix domain-containing protein [Roseibacterium persicicum]